MFSAEEKDRNENHGDSHKWISVGRRRGEKNGTVSSMTKHGTVANRVANGRLIAKPKRKKIDVAWRGVPIR